MLGRRLGVPLRPARVARRHRRLSRRESAASAWHLLGSALAFAAGGALATIDLALPYVATACVAAIAAVLAHGLPEPVQRTPPRTTWAGDVVLALADVARNGRLAWMVGYSAVAFALLRATVYVYQPYLDERGLGPTSMGLVYAAVSLVAAAVAHRTPALRARAGDRALLWSLLATLAASFVALAGVSRGPWMLALLAVQAAANGIYSPLTKPLLNAELRDSSRRAAVLSVESMARRAMVGVLVPRRRALGRRPRDAVVRRRRPREGSSSSLRPLAPRNRACMTAKKDEVAKHAKTGQPGNRTAGDWRQATTTGGRGQATGDRQ